MGKIGKRLQAARAAFEGKQEITVEEAVSLIKANANTKLEMLRSGDTLKPLNANSFELTIGVTYDYSQVTTNGGSLTASLEFSAIQQS